MLCWLLASYAGELGEGEEEEEGRGKEGSAERAHLKKVV
jgi:hypothetical protein